jgi:hypothetical protein
MQDAVSKTVCEFRRINVALWGANTCSAESERSWMLPSCSVIAPLHPSAIDGLARQRGPRPPCGGTVLGRYSKEVSSGCEAFQKLEMQVRQINLWRHDYSGLAQNVGTIKSRSEKSGSARNRSTREDLRLFLFSNDDDRLHCISKALGLTLSSADSCNHGHENGLGTHGREKKADQPALCVHRTDTI